MQLMHFATLGVALAGNALEVENRPVRSLIRMLAQEKSHISKALAGSGSFS
jgi:hypothetical protein